MKMGKRIGIIGASASGIYTALLAKYRNPSLQITLFDRTDKIGKKVLATGNGHCNLLHDPFLIEAYNHPDFVSSLLHSAHDFGLKDALNQLHIETMTKGELVYPLSYSAPSYVRYLSTLLEKAGVEIHLGEKVSEVHGAEIRTDKGKYVFDQVVFAFGGCSQPNLGSDGSLFPVLKALGYHIVPLRPGLCPLRCADVPKSLSGVRHAAKISLVGEKTLYEENGEVLFKKDGVSGICIMNASLFFKPGTSLVVDFFPDRNEEDLSAILERSLQHNGDDFLLPILEKPLMEFFLKKGENAAKTHSISEKARHYSHLLKHTVFHPTGLYPFEESQVSCGGVSLDDVDEHLRSKVDPRHYFVGECLDIHGLCGGHNLGFALLSALVASGELA